MAHVAKDGSFSLDLPIQSCQVPRGLSGHPTYDERMLVGGKGRKQAYDRSLGALTLGTIVRPMSRVEPPDRITLLIPRSPEPFFFFFFSYLLFSSSLNSNRPNLGLYLSSILQAMFMPA